jgi:hypothetical protein
MNNEFTELIRLLGDAGYEVRAISQEPESRTNDMLGVLCPHAGDIFLKISPAGKTRAEAEGTEDTSSLLDRTFGKAQGVTK